MKESERIRAEAAADISDNDWRDVGYLRKIERAKRKESFEEYTLPLLKEKYNVIQKGNEFDILTDKFGRLLYYPKANSLLIVRDNYWVKRYGLNWIKCRICGGIYNMIGTHLPVHKMEMYEYIRLYPEAPLKAKIRKKSQKKRFIKS